MSSYISYDIESEPENIEYEPIAVGMDNATSEPSVTYYLVEPKGNQVMHGLADIDETADEDDVKVDNDNDNENKYYDNDDAPAWDADKKLFSEMQALETNLTATTTSSESEIKAEEKVDPRPTMGEDKSIQRELKLPSNSSQNIIPIPLCSNLYHPDRYRDGKYREVLFITGQSGSGKTRYAERYIRLWRLGHDDREVYKIYQFSSVPPENNSLTLNLNTDSPSDTTEIKQIELNASLYEEPLQVEQFEDALVVFDDIDSMPDASVDKERGMIKKAVQALREELMKIGRHTNTYVINTSHEFVNWKDTRSSLTEATGIVFFPQIGTTKGIVRFLEKHLYMPKHTIDKILSLQGGVTIHTGAGGATGRRFVVHDKGIFLL